MPPLLFGPQINSQSLYIYYLSGEHLFLSRSPLYGLMII
jgi:hypothetical protein